MGLKRISIVLSVFLLAASVFSADIEEMDSRAQEHYDRKEFTSAISLWLAILDLSPGNEKIQSKIEMIYDLKQRKDVSLQRAKLNYRIALKNFDSNYDLAKRRARLAIDDYIEAYRIDPEDQEVQLLKDDMKVLNDRISAEEERQRLSRELRMKADALAVRAAQEMEKENYPAALAIWNEILSFLPQDVNAQEGKRKCELAIQNRIRFETIKSFIVKGKTLFQQKEFRGARLAFSQALNLDPKNREAKDYLRDVEEELNKLREYEQRRVQAESFYQAGLQSVSENDFVQALDDFESALALIDNYRDARQRISDIARLRKEYEEREKTRRLQTIDREFQRGVISFTEGRYREAISAFDRTLTLDPGNSQAKEFLRRAKDAEREMAEEVVDEFSPYYDIVNSLVVSGKALFQRKKYQESREKWAQILNLFPKNAIAIEYILKCDVNLNPERYRTFADRIISQAKEDIASRSFKSAVRKLELIKSIQPDYPGLSALLARAGNAARSPAADLKPGVVPADPAEIERRLRLAAQYFQRGGRENYRLALENYRWITERNPENIQAVIGRNKIESQLRIGQAAPDRPAARTLTAEQRALVNRHYYNGINFYTNNDFRRAIEEWRRVLAIDPNHVKARNNIRKSLGFLGR